MTQVIGFVRCGLDREGCLDGPLRSAGGRRLPAGRRATLLGGEVDGGTLEVDHAKLLEALIEEAQTQTGMPVLRLWYDGAFNSQPTPEHRTLRVLEPS